MGTYTDQYKDSRWQKKRLEIMERDNFACRSCGKSEDVTLNVHHAYYEKGKKVWEYKNGSLVTWCQKCHKIRHALKNDILEAFSSLDAAQCNGLWRLGYGLGAFKSLSELGRDKFINDEALSMAIKSLAMCYEDGQEDSK